MTCGMPFGDHTCVRAEPRHVAGDDCRCHCGAVRKWWDGTQRRPAYDIALRPHVDGHPRMDDIVVNNVACFRAEDMTGKSWWVACYLANGEEVVFWVTAKSRPLRLEWVVTEEPDVIYEEQ